MFCRTCGLKNHAIARFCNSCGTQLVASASSGDSPWWARFNRPLGGFVAIALVLFFALFVFSMGSTTDPSNAGQTTAPQPERAPPEPMVAAHSNQEYAPSCFVDVISGLHYHPGTYLCSENESACAVMGTRGDAFKLSSDCTVTWEDNPVNVRIVP
jgi:hypothetical protein